MYYDYHTHTDVSEDSVTPADEMIEAAIKKGVVELAITDHFDPDYPDPDFTFEPDLQAYHSMLLDKQKQYRNRIKIVKGIEIGLQKGGQGGEPADRLSQPRAGRRSHEVLR